MSNWGQGVVNNSIGWGQGKDNTTNGWGTVYETSNAGDTALEITLVPPVNTVAPAITGTAEIGQTLSCSTGTWSGSPTYAYQWKRGGVNIGGATNSTYVLVAADEGESIKCTVTATNGAGSTSADSNTVTPTWEADAQAFITAASITDPTQQSAINQLVVDLKGYSLWSKMKAIYPFVGGSASSHKWNLKDPRDLNAAYRLSFVGGWIHSSTGADPNGTTAYADTFLTSLTTYTEHLSFYSGENTATATSIDIGSVSNAGNRYFLSTGVSSTSSVYGAFGDPPLTSTDSASGFHCVSLNGTTAKLYKNGINTDSDTVSVTPPYAGSVWIGCSNGINYYSNRQARFATIGTGLSDTDVSNLYTAVQAFQTSLSRNV